MKVKVFTPKRVFNPVSRAIVDSYDLPNNRRVKIRTTHHKISKSILTYVSECTVTPCGADNFYMETWIQGKDFSTRVAVVPCSRYSDNALNAAHLAAHDEASRIAETLIDKNLETSEHPA